MKRRFCLCQQQISDRGKTPAVWNVSALARANCNFRTAIWTGEHLQMTLMSIPVGCEIGPEMHPHVDQMLRVEEGRAQILFGSSEEALHSAGQLTCGCVFFVPAGKWHNVRNTGRSPLKLSSVYGPPNHPTGTVHRTKADAERAEH